MATDGPTVLLDAGGLIAVERGAPVMQQVIRDVGTRHGLVVVPAPVLAQVWRGDPRQALLSRFLRLPHVEVDLLTRAIWQAAGVLCGNAGTSDVVDAAVVVCARERGARVVVTSDPADLGRLDADLALWTP